MTRISLRIAIVLVLLAAGLLVRHLLGGHVLSVQDLKQYKEQLLLFVGNHYLRAVLLYILFFFATAFFFPGALVLTVAGGLAFGTIPATLYANVGATAGAVSAFAAARFLLGHALQKRFRKQLIRFNSEMAHHGHNYLLMLRIVPVAPFFVINYCAALTRVPLKTFAWTTAVGILPGSLLYSFLGEQFRYLETPLELLSAKTILAFGLLALLALLPVILHHLPSLKK